MHSPTKQSPNSKDCIFRQRSIPEPAFSDRAAAQNPHSQIEHDCRICIVRTCIVSRTLIEYYLRSYIFRFIIILSESDLSFSDRASPRNLQSQIDPQPTSYIFRQPEFADRASSQTVHSQIELKPVSIQSSISDPF